MVTPAGNVKNLGCFFDEQLKIDSHMNNVCKAALFHLYNIRRIRTFLSYDCTKTLINAVVTSVLDYFNSILNGLRNNQPNAAARVICNVGGYDHITPMLCSLHWLPIYYRIQFKILLLVCKAIQGFAPDYVIELIGLNTVSSGQFEIQGHDL